MIPKWKLKAVVQKTISFFPMRERINYLFQRYVTKGVLLNDEHFGLKLMHAADHLRFFDEYLDGIKGKKGLELGTGWYPIVPIALYLYGAEEVISLDIQSWLKQEGILTTIEMYKTWHQDGRLQEYLPDMIPERWDNLMKLDATKDKEQLCKAIHLVAMLRDARATELPADSLDFICSNNTFEHIFEDVLVGILKEFKRIIKPQGVMSHFIDMSDHFAHFDKSITIYNFLKYSHKKWSRIDNRIQPQNRLRYKDFVKMYEDLDLPITKEELRDGNVEEVKSVGVHEEWNDYTIEELAISHAYMVSKMNKQ